MSNRFTDEFLQLMYSKLDTVARDVADTKVTQALQEGNLRHLTKEVEIHVKRSDALEALVLPLKRKFDMLDGALKLIGATTALVAFIAAAIKVLEFVKTLL